MGSFGRMPNQANYLYCLSHMIFSIATEADIDAMSALRLAVTENVLRNPSRITRQMYEDYLQKLGRGWVCKIDGRLVGFSYAASDDASIWALFVQPGFEGLGIGSRLLALAVDWLFDERGAATVRLSTGAGTRAERFYDAQGWQREAAGADTDVHYSLARADAQRLAGARKPQPE